MKVKNILMAVVAACALTASAASVANVDVKAVAAAAKQAGAEKAAGVFEGVIAQSNRWVASEVSTVFKAVLNGSSLYPYLPMAYEAYKKDTAVNDPKVSNVVSLLKALEKALEENDASTSLASVVEPMMLTSLQRQAMESSANQLGVNTNGPSTSTVSGRRADRPAPSPVTPAPISPQN